MEYYSAKKKKVNPAICTNTDRPSGHYAKWNKSGEKYKYIITSLISHIYGTLKTKAKWLEKGRRRVIAGAGDWQFQL